MSSHHPPSLSESRGRRSRTICWIFRAATWSSVYQCMRSSPEMHKILLMEEILHQLIWTICYYLQGFIYLRWCRISSINSMNSPRLWSNLSNLSMKDLVIFDFEHLNFVRITEATLLTHMHPMRRCLIPFGMRQSESDLWRELKVHQSTIQKSNQHITMLAILHLYHSSNTSITCSS